MSPIIVLNGELRLADEALVPVSGALASFGEGALEVFRTTPHGPFLAARHLKRLGRTCEKLGIPAQNLEEDLIRDLAVVSVAGEGPWRLRLIRSRADGGAMRALFAEPFEVSELLASGARLTLREGIVTPLAMKTTSYVASRVFRREAQSGGFDECLLHLGGRILEGASSNIVLVKGGILVSPLSPWILEGVTLERVVELAADIGISTERRPVHLDELAEADEVFMTSAARGPIPVRQVGTQEFRVGSVFVALRNQYEKDLQSDWGELQQETVTASQVVVERRLSSMGLLEGNSFRVGQDTFLVGRSSNQTTLRLSIPSPGGGLRLRGLAKALRREG